MNVAVFRAFKYALSRGLRPSLNSSSTPLHINLGRGWVWSHCHASSSLRTFHLRYLSSFGARYYSLKEVTLTCKPDCEDQTEKEEKQQGKTFSRELPDKYNCSGCGAPLQSAFPERRGYIPEEKLKEYSELINDPKSVLLEEDNEEQNVAEQSLTEEEQKTQEEEDDNSDDIEDYFPETLDDQSESKRTVTELICKRCFSLKHYNTAQNIILESDDYLRHLASLKDKRALIIILLDIADFPSCIFPNLNTLISPKSSVLIVANKIDLFPKGLPMSFWNRFRNYVVKECRESSLGDCDIVGVRFVSVRNGTGVIELSEEIARKWGNRGDVYLLGCTNVGKSSLFNKLLVHLCGSKPGELNEDSNLLTPKATISLWPGTTLGLLSFPLMSMGKRRRLLNQQKRREEEIALGIRKFDEYQEGDDFSRLVQKHEDTEEVEAVDVEGLVQVEVEGVLEELGLWKKKKPVVINEPPQNRFWLHDTPGAINDAQLINYLTTKELTLGLPKVPLKPKTFILKPGQCMFLGGLARLDYLDGPDSAYFTVFTWSYINIHATKMEMADILYQRHMCQPSSLFKLPLDSEKRGTSFPPLEHETISVRGTGWKRSAADIILSSVGWVAVTMRDGGIIMLRAHTPKGKGIHVRQPALFDEAINQRGKRERHGNRTAFLGSVKRRKRKKMIP